MLELRELVKHYSSGDGEVTRALDGVSMSIGAGELVALYGPSGSWRLAEEVGQLLAEAGVAVVCGGAEPRPRRDLTPGTSRPELVEGEDREGVGPGERGGRAG